MRYTRIFTFAAVAFGLAACSEPSNEPKLAKLPPLAYVRYINAIPDTLNTTVRFQDQVEYSPQSFVNVAFRGLGAGNYQPTEAGNRKFKVFTADAVNWSVAGNTQVLQDTDMSFEAGKYYTVLHAGFARPGGSPAQHLVQMVDDTPVPQSGLAMRIVNLAYGVGAVDVYKLASATSPISGAPMFANVGIDQVTAYQTTGKGAFAIAITAAGTTNILGVGTAPAGQPANPPYVEAIGGSAIDGSTMTIIAYPSSANNMAGTGKFTTPGVAFYLDQRPPK